MNMPAERPLQLLAKGFRIATEARLVRADSYAGVFHVLSDGTYANTHSNFKFPIVIIVPGKWKEEAEALRAASDYANLMAKDGSLEVAVALRLSIIR